jgi:hypothetical protein
LLEDIVTKMSAEERAAAAGTSPDCIIECKTQDFLIQCLQRGVRKGKYDQDLLQDIADACEINDLDALTLGSGTMTVSEASEKLFLMPNEASAILEMCRIECLKAGVNFGDGAVLDPADLDDNNDEASISSPGKPHDGAIFRFVP